MISITRKLLLAAVFLPVLLLGQNVPNMDNYQPARSNGPLPTDFLLSTIQKYERDKQKIDQGQDKDMQKAQEEFYLQTHYSVDQMRFNGSLLVNDTMSLYVNRVADTLLKKDPELRSKLTFFVMKSPVVNAFTTDQGLIFVTVGLLTRLHNEAELAFVLAHEIIHYKRHHVLTGYVEGVKAKEGLDQYEATTFENRYLKRHRYARSQESQADEEGFEIIAASNYDPRAAIGAFDILALADAPFSDTLFSKSFFEGDLLVFPSSFYTDTVKPVKPQDEDEDDDLATHPSVYKRRKAIVRKYHKLEDTTGSKFLVSETMFWRVKAMARFEECSEHTSDGEYIDALYSNYAEQKYYPDNRYLEKEMVRALYVSVIKKNRLYDFENLFSFLFSLNTMTDDDKPVGELGRLRAFINKTDATGWNVAALHYAWDVHRRYPDDPDILLWCKGLSRELAVKNELRMKDFQTSDSLFISIGNKAMEDTAVARKVKGNTPSARFLLALDNLKKDSLQEYHYWQFALVNDFRDTAFSAMMNWAFAYADSLALDDSLWDEKTAAERKKIKDAYREAFYGPQGFSKVVAVNPIYVSYDYRNENSEIDVRKSIDGREALVGEMKKSASLTGLELAVLSPDEMDSTSVARYNDLALASEWFDQRDNYGDYQILPYPQQEMKELAKKYGTNYFMWSAYVTHTDKRGGTFFRVFGLAAAPVAPHILYRLFTPRQDTYFIAIVYDVTTGKPVFVQKTTAENQRASDSRMRLYVFDLMNQLHKPKKQK